MMKFCPKCGAKLPDDAVFCEKCGAKIDPDAGGSSETTYPQNNNPGGTTGTYNAPSGSTTGSPQQNRGFYNSGPGNYGSPQQNNYNQPAQGGFTPNNGSFNGPGNSGNYGGGKKSDGIPIYVFIGAGVLALVVLVATGLTIKNKISKVTEVMSENSGNGSVNSVTVTKESSDASPVKNGYEETQPGSSVTSSGLSSENQEALDTAMKVLSGGVSENDKTIVKIPSGATVKTTAEYYELIGEYEGEIQLSALDGFEDIDGVPSDFADYRKEALSKPLNCTLTIDDDGEWELEYDFMGGMGMDTDSIKPDEVTPQQRAGFLITQINGGYYHASISAEGDIEGDKSAKVDVDHIGAYCTKGSDRLIAGYYYMHGIMYGADITIRGDFNVKKTSEDIEPTLEYDAGKKGKADDVPVFDENDPESMKYYGFSDDDESDDTDDDSKNDTSASTKKKSDSDTSSKKDDSDTVREIPTISGGQWTKMKSGAWIYEKNGRLVKDVWVEDKGKYYYIDEDGYMLTDAYTPDGYWVKSDGSWDSNVRQNNLSRTGNLPDGVDDYDPSTFAVTGGEWDYLQDGARMYKDSKGKYVKNAWVESKGKYYFIGPDGTMIYNNYASDGFWTNDKGEWSKDVPQRTDDPEPLSATYEGFVSTWKIKILKNGTYGTATFTYTDFGGNKEVYTLTPLGHGSYLAQSNDEPEYKALMTVSSDRKYLIVSQAGITEECKAK